MSKKILEMTVSQLSGHLAAKEISAVEATTAYIDNIDSVDGDVGAYIRVTARQALEQAAEVDRLRTSGEELSPLAGIPAGIKDNICTKGIQTTCGSKMLENFIPPYNATVIDRLEQRHVVMLGKLNMDEFAMGSTNEYSYFKPTRNPHDLSRVPGGSSGGAAAAVAAQEAAFALGSDTGGSVRQPAAFCGVVGIKPTYGAVSRNGLIAFASSLDQIGPMTKNVRDSAMVMEAIAGHDAGDATSLDYAWPSFTKKIEQGVQGLRIGLPKEHFGEGISAEMKDAVLKAAAAYEKLGAKVEEISVPNVNHALPAYFAISSAEASSNLARFDGIKYGFRADVDGDVEDIYTATRNEGFGLEVKSRIMLGNHVLSADNYDSYYKKAMQVRTLIIEDFNRAFENCDFILSPTTPTTAFKLGEKHQDPSIMFRCNLYTVPANIAGIPALSLPCGTDSKGLPIGMQLMGKQFDEPLLYRAAYAYEQRGNY
ncbi:MAG: Asp-tRNA(Asn)/Glu-tRNA(Gln) amidotransferase subunit GatA [Oscillospiraceae bacterium]|nr:Asp-tRNA(Asn)/Glu-tRNA(Gln) amidotransferase subunit GatA [Oscillospiraceae bacterium]MDD4546822.1 Asp-tRNA(Asn)/Glu-tRNA(Gln) amidotransferase subunit GatA [Oscillospiraceae bacterium]